MDSRVTTGHGDGGESMALNGKRYSKAHPIMECVGRVDELRAHMAVTRLLLLADGRYVDEAVFVEWLMHVSFVLGAECSDPTQARPSYHPKRINAEHLAKLESEQQRLETASPMPRAFIAGAANAVAAEVDVLCTVTRKLERSLVSLREAEPAFQCEHILPFVNRLSDFFFVLARWLEQGEHLIVDYDKV
jgi:cob(I)alamin adenosyltransferase